MNKFKINRNKKINQNKKSKIYRIKGKKIKKILIK
jgi:hypothetical protein